MYYTPKRPIKSFQDLEVYQKLLAVSVAVAKRIPARSVPLPTLPDVKNMSLPKALPPIGGADIADVMVKTALDLPIKIATAHSMRFTDQVQAIATLEEVMLGCNLLVVYLEQYRDIENSDIEIEFFDQQIEHLTTCRWKVMHLARSWEKFTNQNIKQ